MNFYEEYKKIISCIKPDIDAFTGFSAGMFSRDLDIENILLDYLSQPGKLLRPALVFLFTRALGLVPGERHFRLAFCIEMIHNASLVHDDIIDSAPERRGQKTLHTAYDSRFAVIAGDYLLAKAIETVSYIKNTEIIDILSNYIKMLICGETKQYFSRYDALSMEDYIEKSKNKTASLFLAALESAAVLNDSGIDYSDFAQNFGIAFQIHNDLKNFTDSCLSLSEKTCDDIKNGTYTAPVIFYMKENNLTKINNPNDVLNCPNRAVFEEKTRGLIKSFAYRAIENINCLEDNQYKKAIIDLCNLYTGDRT